MSFLAFLKKEIKEIFKTSKAIILAVIFIFFGILSPLSAKFTNEILAMVGEQQGIKIQLPDPTYIQSYEQFFKNIYFMMIIIIILIFAGSIVEEKNRGTATLVLTKCLSRQNFILAKFISAVLLFTCSFALSTAIFIYYTSLLFPQAINKGTFLSLLTFWVYGLLIISITLFSSIISKSFTIVAIEGFIAYAVISALAAVPYIDKYTPGMLQVLSVELIRGTKASADVVMPILISIGLSIAAITGGIAIFRKQEL